MPLPDQPAPAPDADEWHVRKPNGQHIGPYATHAEALAAARRVRGGTPVRLPK